MASNKSPRPNHTQFPNNLLDWSMEKVTPYEWMALCYIVRHTFGFQKWCEGDAISLDQFIHGVKRKDGTRLNGGCGIKNRTALVKALSGLEEKGFIEKVQHASDKGLSLPNSYRVVLEDESDQYVTRTTQGEDQYSARTSTSTQRVPVPVRDAYPLNKEGNKEQKKVLGGDLSLSLPLETRPNPVQGSGSGGVTESDTSAQRAQDFKDFLDYWQAHIRPVSCSHMNRFADQYYKARARVGHSQMMGCLHWKVDTDPGCRARTTFAPVFVEQDIPQWQDWLARPAEEDSYGKGVKLRTSMVGCGPTLPEPEDIDLPICWQCMIAKGGEHKPTCPHRLTNPIVQGDEPRVA